MITVILDTSVLISVLISRGKSFARDILKLAYDKKIQVITCDEAFVELQKSVKAERIKKFKTYNPARVGSFIAWYKYNAHFVFLDKKIKPSTKSRDSKDDLFIILAETIEADFLITIDNDLLILKKVKNTNILTPEEFMNTGNIALDDHSPSQQLA